MKGYDCSKTRRRRWELLGAVLSVALLTGSEVRARPVTIVRVGVYQNEPKVFVDRQGAVRGIFPDLLTEVAQDEGWQLVYVPGSWQTSLDRLQTGKIDLMPDVCYTETRSLQFALNREPVLSDWFGVYSRGDVTLSSILDLAGKRIAVLSGSVQQSAFQRLIDGFKVEASLIPVADYAAAAEQVRSGETDAMLSNRYASDPLRRDYGLKQTPVIFNPSSLHVAAPLQGRETLLDAIDRHVSAWKADPQSVYYRILKNYTGESPRQHIPVWLIYASMSGVGLLLLVSAAALLLRWQVRVRTADLQRRTEELAAALSSLKAAQEKAVQQERLHALGQMASGVAHDFNNILMPIVGWADLLQECPEIRHDENQLCKALRLIVEAGKNGAAIVGRMREFYRHRENPVTCHPVLPKNAIDRAVELTRPRWAQMSRSQGFEITVDTQFDSVSQVLADETELCEALINLIVNATDAMPHGGQLFLRTTADADTVRISVRDTGCGMSEETRAKCLTAFFTTKGSNGTGMGLPMVKIMCDRYGGHLEVDSAIGVGTTVTLVLARAPDEHMQAAPASSSEKPAAPMKPLRVLVVDDEPTALEVIAEILSAHGCHVSRTTDPVEALRMVAGAGYDLVITDRAMPHLSGVRLARELKKRNPALPVVILTGSAGMGGKEVDLGHGQLCPVLTKPLVMREFLDIISKKEMR